MTHHEWPRGPLNPFIAPSANDHLRPDAGRIAHRDCEKWLFDRGQVVAGQGGAVASLDGYAGKF
jgi:hypothetical protein